MEIFVRKLGIKKTFVVFALLLGVGSILSSLFTIYFITSEQATGKLINMAGRQRMLTQKMTKEALALSKGVNSANQRNSLEDTKKLFEDSLANLKNGNILLDIPAPKNPQLIQQLSVVENLWAPFKQNIDAIISNPTDSTALNFLVSNNKELLKASNQAVSIMEKTSKGNFDLLSYFLYFNLAIVFFVVGSMIWSVSIVNSLLSEAAEQFSKMAQAQKWISQKYLKSIKSLKDAVVNQSSATQETAATMEQMNAMNRMTSERLQKCSEKTTSSISMANKAENDSMDMKSTMEELVSSQSELMSLGDMVGSIGEQTNIINDIAFKTQLLSFNASIEAARAGAQGRGFSVVASEVGNLANTSADSARTIESSIGESVKRVKDFIEGLGVSIKSTSKHSDDLTHQIKDLAGDISNLNIEYTEMHTAINQNRASIQQTIEATRKLAHGIDQINSEVMSLADESSKLRKASDRLENIGEVIEQLTKGAA